MELSRVASRKIRASAASRRASDPWMRFDMSYIIIYVMTSYMIYSTHSTLSMHAAHMRARFDPRFGEVVFSPPTAGNMLINNLAEAP